MRKPQHGLLLMILSGMFTMLLVSSDGVVHGAAPVQAQVVQTPAPNSGDETQPADDWLGLSEFGEYPRSAYEISCNGGRAWDGGRKMTCAIQGLPFGATKMMVGLAGTVLGWSMDKSLTAPVVAGSSTMADAYNTYLVGDLRLRDLAFSVAVVYCSWLVLRRRTSQAAGEFAVTLFAMFLSSWLISNPAGYLDGYLKTTEAINGQIVATLNGTDSASLADAVKKRMHQSFVAEPYDLLNWGEPLTDACADARNEILATAPHGNDDKPRDMMKDAGCEKNKKFNENPSWARFGGGFVLMIGGMLLIVLVFLLSIGTMVFQLLLLPLWAGMPVVLTLAMMPGGGRRLLGWWTGAMAGVGFLYLATTAVLVFVSAGTDMILKDTSGMGIMKRMLLLDLVIITGFVIRKKAIAAAKGAGRAFGDSVNRAMPARANQPGWTGLQASRTPVAELLRDVPGGNKIANHTARYQKLTARRTAQAQLNARNKIAKWAKFK